MILKLSCLLSELKLTQNYSLLKCLLSTLARWKTLKRVKKNYKVCKTLLNKKVKDRFLRLLGSSNLTYSLTSIFK